MEDEIKSVELEGLKSIDSTENEDLDTLLKRINNERTDAGHEESEDTEDTTNYLFKFSSDIGKDDYRAFVYYSVLRKSKWFLPSCIIAPPVVSILFAFADNSMNLPLAFGITGILYLLLAAMIVFRTERSLSKNNKSNPDLMKLTKTTFTFLRGAVINSKESGEIRVPYKNLYKVCETKLRIILYFAGKKAMLIRKEDIGDAAAIEKFKVFVTDKVSK